MPKTVISKTRANRLAEVALEVADDIQAGRVRLISGELCLLVDQKLVDDFIVDMSYDRPGKAIKVAEACKGPRHCAMGELLARVLPPKQYRQIQLANDPNPFIMTYLKAVDFGALVVKDRLRAAIENVIETNDTRAIHAEDLGYVKFKVPALKKDERADIAQVMRRFALDLLALAHGKDNVKTA